MSIVRTWMVMRMFARLIGRVPTSHLCYLFRRMRFEKPHRFAGQVRVNTFFPPYPSPAFDRFCQAVIERKRVPYSTYVAVTSRCPYGCEHCSYAGRPEAEMSRVRMLDVIGQIKNLGTCTLGLTGGEPLLRADLEDFIRAAAPEMVCIVFTTGLGLDTRRAAKMAEAGVSCVTIGLESSDPATHDTVRKCDGSFAEAEAAARACCDAGIYLAISTVATREKIVSGELQRMYALGKRWGVAEFRILAPVATGGWRGCQANMLSDEERRILSEFHRGHNRLATGPAIESFAYLESDALFGCGAGFHHLFIDAAGKVCPCDLTPLSFGDVTEERLAEIWERMASFFPLPRRGCLMGDLAGKLGDDRNTLPLPRDISEKVCNACRYEGPLPEGYKRLFASSDVVKRWRK